EPSEHALEAFAKRQLGVDAMQWADQSMGYRLIEALKAMAERAGWSQDLTGVHPALHVQVLKARLGAAIAARRQAGEQAAANPQGAPR
ncbi:MAG TPA: phage protein GemA/Gp16 family protein, partial [Caulobacteraceae bacterium]|nr:phage protein GemA/Gp16 family protein [Caulobacteraceae bacterium]